MATPARRLVPSERTPDGGSVGAHQLELDLRRVERPKTARHGFSDAQLGPRLALSPDEAAALLGVSRDYLDEHILPELRIIRRGRRILIALAELERWLDRAAAKIGSAGPHGRVKHVPRSVDIH
jgi:excisionase family DNA binding protein